MKRIVILCDGTWSSTDSETPTNVVRLAQVLADRDAVGVVQVPAYVPGVGSGQGVTAWARWSDRILGGALGWGLLDNVVEAYRHLVFLYEPGDEIFVFGFSRGAYTARSLTGFIRSTGVVERTALHQIPRAVARYRVMDEPATHPGSDESHAFRAALSSRVATSEGERVWRRLNGHAEAPLLRIAHLGVWDSVGALGVPRHLSVAGLFNRRKYEFHDADLSSLVASARHAVALDERRAAFAPTLWTNIDALNRRGGTGEPPYQQRYFAGDHGSVGGGGDVTALSSIALRWIVEGAARAGLAFDAGGLARVRDEEDPLGPLTGSTARQAGLWWWLSRRSMRDRRGPEALSGLHPSVVQRSADADAGYRPVSLAHLAEKLASRQETGPD